MKDITASRNASHSPFYHPELDALRFGAFFMVFTAHASLAWAAAGLIPPGIPALIASAVGGAGFSGLALFFTLSSYLITELLLREHEGMGSIHVGAFYLRRMVRIWPLYFFFLFVVRPLVGHYLPDEHFPLQATLAFSLLVGNWFCYFNGFPPSVATPLWSISVEEQFYLCWPLLVWRCRRHIPLIAVSMLLIANVSRILLILYPRPDPALWCSTLTRLDPFALGALLAYLSHGRTLRMTITLRSCLLAIAALLFLFVGRSGAHNGETALLFYPLESAATCLVIVATLRLDTPWQPGVFGRAFVYLGRISFGLYVYHLCMLTLAAHFLHTNVLLQQAIALASSIAVAATSYAVLEKPFLRLKRRFTYIASRD